ncbi:MAG: hypothetical protein ACQEXJ_06045 [Myxococcota bacterium]
MARTLTTVLLLALIAVACRDEPEAPEVDCSIYEGLRRGEYVAELPREPERFWRGFEACYAEGGSYCERAWVFFSAQPSMATPSPEEMEDQRAEYLEACGSLPEEVQRCLTSWALSRHDECARVGARRRLNEALGRP